jgi:hypothetical protein
MQPEPPLEVVRGTKPRFTHPGAEEIYTHKERGGIMKKISDTALPMIAILFFVIASCSRILIVDPPRPPNAYRSITTPHDLVVVHEGCGTTDRDSLEAYIYKNDSVQDEISGEFQYTSQRDAWIAEEVHLPEGRIKFGASAHVETSGTCYRSVTGETFTLNVTPALVPDSDYETMLHHEDDEDIFTIRAPVSNFGNWFEISVEVVDPLGYSLFVKLEGPQGSHLESTTQPSAQFWIALKTGVEAKITVNSGDPWPEGQKFVTYRISVASGVIPDSLEPDDSQAKATLAKDQAETAYMCAVMDSAEDCVGFPDWFKYEHAVCKNDCINLSREAEIQICEELGSTCCHNQDEINEGLSQWMKKMCMSQETESDKCRSVEKPGGTRYVSIRHIEDYFGNYHCYGQGRVPDWYLTPYTIIWTEAGDVPWDCP